jgi:hypothetical protein
MSDANGIEAMKRAYDEWLRAAVVLDLDAWWDPLKRDAFLRFPDFGAWRAALRSFGIDAAVVTCAESVRYDALSGNERLARLIEGEQGLYGCMVLTPDIEFSRRLDAYVDSMLARKFVASRMYPKSYMHSLSDFCSGPTLSVLEERRVPLMLWHSEASWEAIDRICGKYPRLPVIVEGHDVKLLYHARNYIRLLAEHENFHLETHNLVLFDELRSLAEKFGADRLIYGSYFPYNTPHHSLYNVMESRLRRDDQNRILSGNSKKLIEGIITRQGSQS